MVSAMKQLRRAVHTRHVAAGLAIVTAVVGVVAVGLPEQLYSYGLVDGQLTATDIGVFQTKYSIGPDRFGRYLQGRVQNQCDLPEFRKDGAGQLTIEENHCNIALNQKCMALKATSIAGILCNCVAAALCLRNVHRSAVGFSAFASGIYGATWGLMMSIKLGKATSPTARCGFTDHIAYPDIQYGVSFRLTVAASALSIIVAFMMVSHEWTPSPPKRNKVDVLTRREERTRRKSDRRGTVSESAVGRGIQRSSLLKRGSHLAREAASKQIDANGKPAFRKADTVGKAEFPGTGLSDCEASPRGSSPTAFGRLSLGNVVASSSAGAERPTAILASSPEAPEPRAP